MKYRQLVFKKMFKLETAWLQKFQNFQGHEHDSIRLARLLSSFRVSQVPQRVNSHWEEFQIGAFSLHGAAARSGGAGIDLIVSKTARKVLKGFQGIFFGTVHKKQIFKCWWRCGAPSVSGDVINDSLSLWKDHFQRTNNDQSSQAEGLWSSTYYVTYMVWLVSLHCTSSG